MLIDLLTALYFVCAVLVTLYTFGYVVLLIAYLLHHHHKPALPHLTAPPRVLVQLPIYNERHVVARLLDAVAALEWPRDKLSVQVLDDSTDETTALVAQHVARLRADGLDIQHVRRPDRSGYKAGALAYGLTLTDAEYVALFDADFVPPRDFLAQTVPHFLHDARLGIVQARWGSLNADANLLTKAQALSIDTHFVIEQTARNRAGLLLTFNGTGGVWRRACIDDAGGWSSETLTEDLDLSYRAQLRGWHYLFLPDVVVFGEIPPQIEAYKRQQARWAKGTNQAMLKLLPRLRTPNITLGQRIMAVQHLAQYLPAPLLLLMLLVTPPLLAADALERLPLAPLGIVGIIPPLMHLITQMRLNPKHWLQRMVYFPLVMMLGSAMVLTNTRAAFDAFISRLSGQSGEFVRTPKFGQHGQMSAYAFKANGSVFGESLLTIYAAYGVSLALKNSPAIAPYLMFYTLSFALVVFWGLRDTWQITHIRQDKG